MSKKIVFYLAFATMSLVSFGQQNEKYFEVEQKIQNLLDYKEKSPSQLRGLLTELQKYSKGYESSYEQMKLRVDNYLLPIEIKLARSEVYNKQYSVAVKQMKGLKLNYPYRREIENFESYLDRKLFKFFKNNLLETTSSIFSIEPSYSLYSQEQSIKGFGGLANFNPVYGLGLYYKFNRVPTHISASKSRFSFSQIGLKLEFRDTSYTWMRQNQLVANNGYFGGHVSLLFKKTLGLDLGMISYSKGSGFVRPFYTVTTSFYIPMAFLSVGINARVITDFTSTNPLLQLGATAKLNLGYYKPFSIRAREEVKSQVIKYKEH